MPPITATVLAGPASVDLASKISSALDASLVIPELKVFADGESKVRFPVAGGICLVVQSTYPPVDTHLMQAMMMARKCTDDGAAAVCAVIPYLAYARQDRPFLEGEFATISLVAKLLEAAGVSAVITVDMHSRAGISQFAPIDMENVSSIPLLADYAGGMKLRDPIAVSPDAGGAERVKEFASLLKCEMLVLSKTRNRSTGQVTIQDPDRDFGGRDVLLVDDMISSGGSIATAAQVLRGRGAGRIYAMCAHALLIGDASKNLAKAGVDDIISTNSIPNQHAKVDLSRAIAKAVLSRYGPLSV